MVKVLFDVDSTLIKWVAKEIGDPCREKAVPNYDLIQVYRYLQSQGCYMVIHSGGGGDYARSMAERLGLEANEYIAKDISRKDEFDISFDDEIVSLAKINIRIK